MLNLIEATLSRGTKVLLEQASFSLFEKQKMGLTGRNGCGKSTLFQLILNGLALDSGELQLSQTCRVSHLSQEIPHSDEKAIDFVLSGDEDYASVIHRLAKAEQKGDDAMVLACHETLADSGGYAKPAQAGMIMSGLGFSGDEQELRVSAFSGGWRMRLSLARCLMKPADLLLLDEPTNHLDMEAIFWLEKWLKTSQAAALVVSHDREFLDAFATHILHIEHQKTHVYTGNYSQFERARAEKLALQQTMHEKQQKQIAHLQSFVTRFKAKASKAKQAQSRVKAIERMELVAAAQVDSPFSFEFFPCPKATNPLIRCDKAFVGYSKDKLLIQSVDFQINLGDRFALLGPNGTGKSTFIKTLIGEQPTLSGEVRHSHHLNIGYFAQHQLESLNMSLSPVQTIQALAPQAREQIIRSFLGGFNFKGDMALSPITHFSGGEKARLALAKLVWLKPNLLLLDEPTNHLDLDMRAAIELALQQYEGAIILISHDRHLLQSAVDEYYLLSEQTLKPFDGTLQDYHRWLTAPVEKTALSLEKKPAPNPHARRNTQHQVKKLEQRMEKAQTRLKAIELELAKPAIYASENHTLLQALHDEQAQLTHTLAEDEAAWFLLLDEEGN